MEDVSRWVNLGFVFLWLLLWWLFGKVSGMVMGWFNIPDAHVLGENLTQASLVGLAISSVVTLIMWRNRKLYENGLNIAREIKKVTWPTLDETKNATRTVIITTLIIAAILASFDFVFQKLTAIILGIDS